MSTRRSLIGTEWEREHAGYYTCGDRSIVKIRSRWVLEGAVLDTETFPTLRDAMDRADQL